MPFTVIEVKDNGDNRKSVNSKKDLPKKLKDVYKSLALKSIIFFNSLKTDKQRIDYPVLTERKNLCKKRVSYVLISYSLLNLLNFFT